MVKNLIQKNWWNIPPSNGLQKINIYSTIGLTCIVVFLTIKYGESKDELNELTAIAFRQDKLIGQMQSSNSNLIVQTTLLNKQVNICSFSRLYINN
jgi:hypothetical protein